MGTDTEQEEGCQHMVVTCENDCEEGFEVAMAAHGIILTCRACETEYEITGSTFHSAVAGN